jgi:hypothetical protein
VAEHDLTTEFDAEHETLNGPLEQGHVLRFSAAVGDGSRDCWISTHEGDEGWWLNVYVEGGKEVRILL